LVSYINNLATKAALMHLLPGDFQILHNTGVFQYRPVLLLFFGIKLALMPLSLILLLVCVYRSRPGRRSHRTLPDYGMRILTVCLIVFSCLTWRPLTARLCFARGYNHYLHRRDERATKCYLRSLRLDRTFVHPAYELIKIQEEAGDHALLQALTEHVAPMPQPELHGELGSLIEERGDHARALDFYRQARDRRARLHYSVGVIRCLTALGNYAEADAEIGRLADQAQTSDEHEDIVFCRSLVDFHMGRYADADAAVDKLISSDVTNPAHYLLKAKILRALGSNDAALRMLDSATGLRRDFAEAYFEMALIHYGRRDAAPARAALERTLYYDNLNSLAYVMLAMVNAGTWRPLQSLKLNRDEGPALRLTSTGIHVRKGDTTTVDMTSAGLNNQNDLAVGILEPYGFGVTCTLVEKAACHLPSGREGLRLRLSVEGVRSREVNLNRPWPLNIVIVDRDEGTYVQRCLPVTVDDSSGEEGRILLVITEDLEQTGDFPHNDGTPDTVDNDPYEIRTDLMRKPSFADSLADDYGIKWTHFVEIGSAMLRLKWLQNKNYGQEWDGLWNDMAAYMDKTISGGHDVQLHIHGYHIPHNRLFRQYFDQERKKLLFRGNTPRVRDTDGCHGAWAANFVHLGDHEDPDSRVGSITRGIRLLEGQLVQSRPAYRTVLFRAGEYEFGSGRKEVGKSITALRQNGILADSSAVTASPFSRSFKFHRRIGSNVYFTRSDSTLRRATSLRGIGILELLPVPRLHGHDYLRPTDAFKHVKHNYEACLKGERIENRVFVLMQMYHLVNANSAHEWDRLERDYEDWRKMEAQWRKIRTHCPKIEPVTMTQAVEIFLDRYAPDIVAIRGHQEELGEGVYAYNIAMLGKDIAVSAARPHFVSVKPPAHLGDKIDRVELLRDGIVEKSWNKVNRHQDLTFRITQKGGYRIRLHSAG